MDFETDPVPTARYPTEMEIFIDPDSHIRQGCRLNIKDNKY